MLPHHLLNPSVVSLAPLTSSLCPSGVTLVSRSYPHIWFMVNFATFGSSWKVKGFLSLPANAGSAPR